MCEGKPRPTEQMQRRKKGGCLGSLAALLAVLALTVVAVASVVGAVYVWSVSRTLPTAEDMVKHRPSLATTVYDRNGKVRTSLYYANRQWVKLEAISKTMVKAILAAEDDSKWTFVEGNYRDYEDDKRKRLGEDGARPHRPRYKPLMA